jgi:hypothetical protein
MVLVIWKIIVGECDETVRSDAGVMEVDEKARRK